MSGADVTPLINSNHGNLSKILASEQTLFSNRVSQFHHFAVRLNCAGLRYDKHLCRGQCRQDSAAGHSGDVRCRGPISSAQAWRSYPQRRAANHHFRGCPCCRNGGRVRRRHVDNCPELSPGVCVKDDSGVQWRGAQGLQSVR